MHSIVSMNVTKYRPNEYGSFYISCPLNILIGFGMSSRCKFNSIMFRCYLCVCVLCFVTLLLCNTVYLLCIFVVFTTNVYIISLCLYL
jgi:hypothetical protein